MSIELEAFRTAKSVADGTSEETVQPLALMSIAISLKRIADAIVADIERHNAGVSGPFTRIADEICGVPYDNAPGADNSRHKMGIVDGVMHAIEQGILAASNRG
jgi:hypothetical protein